MSSSRPGYLWAIFGLFLFSGATALIYQVIWLRQLILIFGSTQFATSTILSCFMCGLAVGAYMAGRWLGHSRYSPLKVYGLLEVGIGLYALIVPFLFQGLTPIYRLVWDAGASESFLLLSLAKFAGIGLVLLPPTIMMGASLPVLAREVADDEKRIGGKVGHLYAINTFGAVLGTFCAGFILVPWIGVQKTAWLAAFTNVAVGVIALSLKSADVPASERRDTSSSTTVATVPPQGLLSRGKIRLALIVFGISGFGALVLEVAWTRVLALVLGSSVYAFALMLLAFLVGLATGGAYFSRYLRNHIERDPTKILAVLLAAAGFLSYSTAFLFILLPRMFAWVYLTFHPEPNEWLIFQFILSLLVMFPTTFALGGIFPTVVQLHARRLDQVADSVGTVYAANTVGTILGAAAAGFFLIPSLGVMNTVLGVATIELVLALVVGLFVVSPGASGRMRLLVPIGVACLVVLIFPPKWDVITMNTGVYMNLFDKSDDTTWDDVMAEYDNIDLLYAAEGVVASVFVAEQPEINNIYLAVNGKVEASTVGDMETQTLSSHLPLLFHEDPKDVLLIGLASGITLSSAASHPVETLRVVEIEQKILEASRYFDRFTNSVLDDPRLTISVNDARNDLEFSNRDYDVIISQPSNPWMTVAANLFTEEFFALAKRRLRPGGVFSQWVQNYYLPSEDMQSIVKAFHSAFPYVMLFETIDGVDNLLIGSEHPIEFDLEALADRMSVLNVKMDLARIRVKEPIEILSFFRMGPAEVGRFVADAPRNTDDNARVEYSAPRSLGQDTTGQNVELLNRYRTDPLRYLNPMPESEEDLDRLRLKLAVTWLGRGQDSLAREQVRKLKTNRFGSPEELLMRMATEHEERARVMDRK